ncbi:MAG TPA: NAD-dependent epimerase/dehydratase family protein [Gemmatimonas sp.]|nr:NAD-dependent epimerase/dehydratase family protein [Gemmatimonas sp.]
MTDSAHDMHDSSGDRDPLATGRREFLRRAAGAAALAGIASNLPSVLRALEPSARGVAPLDILVLGGTGFIGPHLVRHAVARGHRVTIFTRGRRTADLPESVTRLVGDRNGQLGALQGKRWDIVIDDSATNPDWVRQSVALLEPSVGAYMFTSSTGVYYPYLKRGLNESHPVLYDAADPNDGSASFGVAKARCERAVMDAFGARGIVVRPTYIVGPGDTTDRFPYWPQRIVRGGEILAPGRRDDPVQIIDVRDLAEFMIGIAERGSRGIYNVAGPKARLTAARFYETAVNTLGSQAGSPPKLVYVDDYALLAKHKVEEAIPWAMLRGNDLGMMSIRNDKAVGAGLAFRALDVTLRDTLTWWGTVPEARKAKPRFTITPEQEAAVLAEWKAR